MNVKTTDPIYKAVLESFRDGVIILDPMGAVIWTNPAAEELLGVSQTVFLGFPGIDLFEGDRSLADDIAKALTEKRSLTERDTRFTPLRGEPFAAEISVRPVDDHFLGGTVIMIRNLTSAKALERFAGMEDRLAELETLAAGFAHEIKNPLGGIRGAAQLLDEDVEGEMKEYTGLILRESDRINRLMEEFIGLNQPEEFPPAPVNVYPILDDAITLVATAAASKRVAIDRYFDPSAPPIIAHPDRLRQIFLNLLKNGVEASKPGTRMTVTTALAWRAPGVTKGGGRSRFLLVEIVDEGDGVDEQLAAKMFTPFYSTKSKGSGLGLVVTQRLVRASNGYLEIVNRPGEVSGAVASVYLPYR
jgi:two-component system nitrogen regulation sensor histidine kinase GlnL